jgi:Fe-S cluster assembly protein SufD
VSAVDRVNPVYRETLDHHRACFERFSEGLTGEPAWLGERRALALAAFCEQGFPHTKLEEWRYTNVAPIAKLAFEPAAAAPEITGQTGVSLASVANLRGTDPERLRGLLERGAAAKDRSFALLADAFLDDGIVVEIARGTAVAQPVQVRFAATEQASAVARHPRVIVTAERDSKAIVVLAFDALASAAGALTNLVVDVQVEANASLELVLVQREEMGCFHVSNTNARVERDARFAIHTVTLGGELVRNDLDVVLADEGAECDLRGLFLGRGSAIVDNHTSVDHAMPHGTSRELYKGILADAARGVFRGKVLVRPDAQKTDATQSNPNILLGARAEIDTKPQLEIYADDVKCAHGATVGQLDPEALFYLQSRGIGQSEGRAMLTRAFASEITPALPDADLAQQLDHAIAEALFGSTVSQESAVSQEGAASQEEGK